MATKKAINTDVRLTNKLVDALSALPPEMRARRYWDTECSSLFLQFSKKGTASYVMRYTKLDGTPGEFAIGPADILSADAARAACKERLSALILNGVDPVEARRAARTQARDKQDTTFRGIAEDYLARKMKLRNAKGKTRKLAEIDLLRRLIYPILGAIDITKINQDMVQEALEEIEIGVLKRRRAAEFSGRTTAVSCHKAMKRVWKYALAKELAIRNPADFTCADDTPVKRRGRMDDDRLKVLWHHLQAGYVGGARCVAPLVIMIYMTTLQRPVDIARARRADIDLAARTWRPKQTKTAVPYFVPLSDLACALISHAMTLSESEWLFPKQSKKSDGHMLETSMGNYWFNLRKRLVKDGVIPDDDINQYDCRRYGRTQLVHKLGFSNEVAELVINHHRKSDISTLYDVYDFEPDIRKAQEAWGNDLAKLCNIDIEHLFDK